MSNDRVIFHIDVNSAFLSWEAIWNLSNGGTEDYRQMLAAVGGDIESRHGIILAKSIPTKAYGIVTGEPVVNALKKCPKLMLIKPHRDIYSRYSKALMNILRQYTDKLEQFSIDEAFLDMTGTKLLFGNPLDAADTIRNRVKEELGFTVNIGISSNKLLAKMASDFTKPDRTHTLFPEEIKTKMWPLPVEDLFFVGQSSAEKLNALGIKTIGDLANFDKTTLTSIMKKHGEAMWNSANGIDDSEVVDMPSDQKGYSNETTLPYDVTETEEAKQILRALTEKVSKRVRDDGVKIECVEVHFRFNDLTYASKQGQLESATNITDEIYENVSRLFDEKWDRTPIRLLGVRVSKIADTSYRQMSLFDNRNYEKLEKLDKVLDSIKNKYGNGAVKRASSIESKDNGKNNRRQETESRND